MALGRRADKVFGLFHLTWNHPVHDKIDEDRSLTTWRTSRARRSATSPTRSAPSATSACKAELQDAHEDRVDATIGTDDNDEAVRLAIKRIDMAASKGIIHKNAAARKKSRLMKKVNAAV